MSEFGIAMQKKCQPIRQTDIYYLKCLNSYSPTSPLGVSIGSGLIGASAEPLL